MVDESLAKVLTINVYITTHLSLGVHSSSTSLFLMNTINVLKASVHYAGGLRSFSRCAFERAVK